MATAGNDQIGFKTGTSTAGFHVVRHSESLHAPGVSEPWRYKWFVDGVQQTPTNIWWVLQSETKGENQQRPRTFSVLCQVMVDSAVPGDG
jgi:hypothetical protein